MLYYKLIYDFIALQHIAKTFYSHAFVNLPKRLHKIRKYLLKNLDDIH